MKHPNQATLALHAGGDLGRIRNWFTARHVARCALCRDEIARFDAVRMDLSELAELPEISWNRLAAEIQANVRLGLAAGECVRTPEDSLPRSSAMGGWRAAVAFASVVLLVAASLLLEHPAPHAVYAARPTVQSTNGGIEFDGGNGQSLSLMNSGAQKVDYTLGAQGTVGARYFDPVTGLVTIEAVSYAQ